MLYKIDTVGELNTAGIELPEDVLISIRQDLTMLALAYGEEGLGGCLAIVETSEDIPAFREIVNFDAHPCEWATKLGSYISALYLLNNDYTILVVIPMTIAPQAILNDLEEY